MESRGLRDPVFNGVGCGRQARFLSFLPSGGPMALDCRPFSAENHPLGVFRSLRTPICAAASGETVFNRLSGRHHVEDLQKSVEVVKCYSRDVRFYLDVALGHLVDPQKGCMMMRNRLMPRFLLVVSLVCFIILVSAAQAAELQLPSGLKTIEKQAFYGDTSLDNVIVQEGTEVICPQAFARSGIKSITLPSSLYCAW